MKVCVQWARSGSPENAATDNKERSHRGYQQDVHAL